MPYLLIVPREGDSPFAIRCWFRMINPSCFIYPYKCKTYAKTKKIMSNDFNMVLYIQRTDLYEKWQISALRIQKCKNLL